MPPRFVHPTKLEEIAAVFLREHHAGLEVPVPIEEIIELDLRMDITPEEGIYGEFAIESWLSHDTSAIHIDAYQYLNMEQRCRFTLAHQFAHLLLHADDDCPATNPHFSPECQQWFLEVGSGESKTSCGGRSAPAG